MSVKLSAAELRVLEAVQEPMTVHAVAEAVDRSDSYTSQVIQSLAEKELVRVERDGKTKQVSPAAHIAVERFHNLVQAYSHIDWAELLSGKALEVLYYLDEPHSVQELATKTRNYRNTVHRALQSLADRGIVGKQDGTYQINDDFQGVIRFVHAYVRHRHGQRVDRFTARYRIIWTGLHTFLVETDEPIDAEHFHATGPAALSHQGSVLELLATRKRYYLYDEEKDEVTPEELLCHLLLIDQGTRFLTYALLYVTTQELEKDNVEPVAARYGVWETVQQCLTYLDTKGTETGDRFPDWDEFTETAEKYEVTV